MERGVLVRGSFRRRLLGTGGLPPEHRARGRGRGARPRIQRVADDNSARRGPGGSFPGFIASRGNDIREPPSCGDIDWRRRAHRQVGRAGRGRRLPSLGHHRSSGNRRRVPRANRSIHRRAGSGALARSTTETMPNLILLATNCFVPACVRPDHVDTWPDRFALSAGPQLGYAIKRVVEKQGPFTLIGDDGSVCRTSRGRFAATKVGGWIACVWAVPGLDSTEMAGLS